jgi:ribosomal subunit interface protein
VDVVVKGRHTEVGDRLRSQAEAKLTKVAKLDGKVTRIDVEVCEERNPRQADLRSRVELTCLTRGPVVRAEAAASDPFAALDLAAAKLESRLRRAADRRRIHHGIKSPLSVAAATAPLSTANGSAPADAEADEGASGDDQPFVVREKSHQAGPMTLDQALFEMELVGHDFYLYVDSDSGLPSVVYRRHGYDYGVIRLVTTGGDAT